jgi:AcrR family transcriptional regulator
MVKMGKQKFSTYLHSHGIENVGVLERQCGVKSRTLYNWYHSKPQLLEIVVIGVVHRLENVTELVDASYTVNGGL